MAMSKDAEVLDPQQITLNPQLLDLVHNFLSSSDLTAAANAMIQKKAKKNNWKGSSKGLPDLNAMLDHWQKSQKSMNSKSSKATKNITSDSDSETITSEILIEKAAKESLKRKTPASSSSSSDASSVSSDSDSESSVSSGSDSSDSSSEDEPATKKVRPSKILKVAKKTGGASSSSSSSSDADIESSVSSDSEATNTDTASDSELSDSSSNSSSSSSSDSESDNETAKAVLKLKGKKKSVKEAKGSVSASSEVSSDSSDSSDSDSDVGNNKALQATPSKMEEILQESNNGKRKRETADAEANTTDGGLNGNSKKAKVEPFSRIPRNIAVDPRFASNAYVPYDYANRAHEKLIVTKGKGFTKEKNKGKRGSYRGGRIDTEPKSIKFD